MSQSGTPIGSARIDFVGNTQQLEAAAARAKQVTAGAVAGAESASSQQVSAQEDTATTIKVAKAVAVGGLLMRATDELLRGIDGFNRAGESLANGLREIKQGLTFDQGKFTGLEGELDAITKRYNDARAKIDSDRVAAYEGIAGLARLAFEKANGVVGAEFDEQLKQVEAVYAASLKQYDVLVQQRGELAAQERARDTRLKQADALTKIQEESISLERSVASEEERINEAVNDRLAAINDLREARKDDPAFLKALEASEVRLENYRRASLDRIVADQTKAADAVAKAYEKAMTSALSAIEKRVTSMFDPNKVDSGMETVIRKIDLIAQQMRRQT